MNDHLAPFNYISICTGGGGLDLGFERAVRNARCVAAVEIESFARAVLAARMEEGCLASCPVYADAYAFSGVRFRGLVDAVIGGTPCQDLSVSGKQAGLDGPKSKLFFAFCRIIEESQPSYVLWENVAGAKKVLPRIFGELEKRGYAGKCVSLRASDVGAPHQRSRFFILARRVANTSGAGRLWNGSRGSGEAEGGGPLGEAQGPGFGLAHADDGEPRSTHAGSVAYSEGERGGPWDVRGGGAQELAQPATDGIAVAYADGAGVRDEPRGSSGSDGSGQAQSPDAGSEVGDTDGERGREERSDNEVLGRKPVADGAGPWEIFSCGCGGLSIVRERERCAWCGGGSTGSATDIGFAQPYLTGRIGPDPRLDGYVADDDDDGLEGERGAGVLDRVGSAFRNNADRRGSSELADASDARLQRSERARAPGEGEGAPRSATERSRPQWPPGPDGDWSSIEPRFFPAQPRVRRVDDGVARELDLAVEQVWADRLRMLGNGVVPTQAEEAIRFLFPKVEALTEALTAATNPGV